MSNIFEGRHKTGPCDWRDHDWYCNCIRPAPAIGETTIDNVTVLYCVRRCAKNRILL